MLGAWSFMLHKLNLLFKTFFKLQALYFNTYTGSDNQHSPNDPPSLDDLLLAEQDSAGSDSPPPLEKLPSPTPFVPAAKRKEQPVQPRKSGCYPADSNTPPVEPYTPPRGAMGGVQRTPPKAVQLFVSNFPYGTPTVNFFGKK